VTIRFGSEIAAAAAAHHLDPRLLAAVAAQETGGPGSNSGNNIIGDGGHGHGLFQIDDRYWAFARTAAALDPAKNADVAAGILGDNLRRSGGDVRAALSLYNAGSPTATGTITRWADGQVLGYADSVLRHYEALGGSADQAVADARGAIKTVDALYGAAAAQPRSLATLGFAPVTPQAGKSTSAQSVAGMLAPPPAVTAPPPFATWTQISATSSNETESADKAVADLVDSGDVFGSEDDSSAGL